MALIKKKRIRTCYFCIPGPLDPYSGVCMYVCMRNTCFPTRLAFLEGEVPKTKPFGQIPKDIKRPSMFSVQSHLFHSPSAFASLIPKEQPPTNPFPSNVLQGQGLINRIELYKLVVRRFHPSEVTTQIIKVKIQIWKGPEAMNKKHGGCSGYIGDVYYLPSYVGISCHKP